MNELGGLGDKILAFLFAYPWLIPFYLLGLWYLVIRPLTYSRKDHARLEERLQDELLESSALEEPGVRDMLERTYQAWRSQDAGFEWPRSLAQFKSHAEQFDNVDAYISDRVRNSSGVISAYAKTVRLRGEPFEDDEFALRSEPSHWLLTNRQLYVFVENEGISTCEPFLLNEISRYSTRPTKIEMAGRGAREFSKDECKYPPSREEIGAAKRFAAQVV